MTEPKGSFQEKSIRENAEIQLQILEEERILLYNETLELEAKGEAAIAQLQSLVRQYFILCTLCAITGITWSNLPCLSGVIMVSGLGVLFVIGIGKTVAMIRRKLLRLKPQIDHVRSKTHGFSMEIDDFYTSFSSILQPSSSSDGQPSSSSDVGLGSEAVAGGTGTQRSGLSTLLHKGMLWLKSWWGKLKSWAGLEDSYTSFDHEKVISLLESWVETMGESRMGRSDKGKAPMEYDNSVDSTSTAAVEQINTASTSRGQINTASTSRETDPSTSSPSSPGETIKVDSTSTAAVEQINTVSTSSETDPSTSSPSSPGETKKLEGCLSVMRGMAQFPVDKNHYCMLKYVTICSLVCFGCFFIGAYYTFCGDRSRTMRSQCRPCSCTCSCVWRIIPVRK